MDSHDTTPAMNQRIFEMGFSTETVSVYLLCCGLVDAGVSLTRKNLRKRWNGTPEQLERGLAALGKHNVIHRLADTASSEKAAYRLVLDPHRWTR
jgi:hypothetical protein